MNFVVVSLYIKRGKVSVRTYVRTYVSYVRNAGRGQLSSEWRHNENSSLMDIAYGDWRQVATGCNALVYLIIFRQWKRSYCFHPVFVCLFVCEHHNSKSDGQIFMKFVDCK